MDLLAYYAAKDLASAMSRELCITESWCSGETCILIKGLHDVMMGERTGAYIPSLYCRTLNAFGLDTSSANRGDPQIEGGNYVFKRAWTKYPSTLP